MASFIDCVCDERIFSTTDSGKAVKGARRCLQDLRREVRTLPGPHGEGN